MTLPPPLHNQGHVLAHAEVSPEPRWVGAGRPFPVDPANSLPVEPAGIPRQSSQPPEVGLILEQTPINQTLATARPAPSANTVEEGFNQGYRTGFEEGRRNGLEQGMAEGRKLGLELGLEEGRERGEAEGLRLSEGARKALDDRIGHMDRLLRQLGEHLQERLHAAEDDMVAVCFTAICRVLGDHALKKDLIAQAVQAAIEQCCGSGRNPRLPSDIAIHVHPDDFKNLREDPGVSSWLRRSGEGSCKWVPDAGIELGGCIIRSESGGLDARLETQLGALKTLLLQTREHQRDASRVQDGES